MGWPREPAGMGAAIGALLRRPAALAVLIGAAGVFLRLVHLGADPEYHDWVGYVTDEGRWVQTARSLWLEGEIPRTRLGELHLALAPLFQAVTFLSFAVLDVGVWSARLWPALAGGAILVVFWRMMRTVAGPPAALVGLSLLAFQTDLVAFSRMAIPEMPVALLALLVYQLATTASSARRALLAGLVTCLALVTKATSAPIVPITTAIIAMIPPAVAGLGSIPARGRNLLAYLTGALAPFVAAGVVVAIADRGVIDLLSHVSYREILDYLGVSDLYAIVSFPFSAGLAWACNAWALGLWLSLLSAAAHRRWPAGQAVTTHLVASAIWIALFGATMVGLSYFPTRYQAVILLPLAIHLSSALSLFLRLGPSAVVEAIGARTGWRGGVSRALLVLPAGVLLAPVALYPWMLAGAETDRLTARLSAVVVLSGLLWVAAQLGRERTRLTWWLLCVPPVLLACAGMQSLAGVTFWPAAAYLWHPAAGIVASLGVAIGTGRLIGAGHRFNGELLSTAAAMGIAVVAFAAALPGHLFPHDTIRRASADLQSLVAECSSVLVLRTEGLFNGNTLRYESRRDLYEGNPGAGGSECLVAAFLTGRESDLVGGLYDETLRRYEIFASAEYCEQRRLERIAIPSERGSWGCPVTVVVHRRGGPPPGAALDEGRRGAPDPVAAIR